MTSSNRPRKTWVAASELLFATSIWGFGFTATIWALRSFDTITITVGRFAIAFIFGAVMLSVNPRTRDRLNLRTMRMAFWPGIFLGLTLLLQTWGLEYTSATNSSFITTLYVVFVPLIEIALLRRANASDSSGAHGARRTLRIGPLHFIWVAIALIGTGLMVNLQLGHFNLGDALTLVCSLSAGLQIIMIGRHGSRIESPFAYNVFQSLWAALVAILFVPIYPHHYIRSPDWHALVGVISLTFGSTLIAFFLQVKAQKTLSASLSSLIFLLESPFASFFAFLLLGEKISMLQALGGVLIFLSAYGATKNGFAARDSE